MDSSRFTPEQVDRMLASLMRHRDYLYRLVERMRVRRFPSDDPVYRAALGAMEKSASLCVTIGKLRKLYVQPPPEPEDGIMQRKPWAG